MPDPSFSIVLCSHNGERTLPRTLAALDAIGLPEGGVEILLVDNASTDATFSHFPERLAGVAVQRLREARLGKSYALNTGIARSCGRAVAFLDDDARPVRDWLLAYDAAARQHPKTDVFCGQVRPDFEIAPPEWLVHLCGIGQSFGSTPLRLNRAIQPVRFSQAKGANLLIRRRALERLGFDVEHFNYSPTEAGGEDTYIVKQITEGGPPPLFVPDACVAHWVSREEMSIEAITARYRRIGRTLERRSGLEAGASRGKRRRKLARYAVKLASQRLLRLAATLAAREGRRSELDVKIAKLTGRMEYLRHLD